MAGTQYQSAQLALRQAQHQLALAQANQSRPGAACCTYVINSTGAYKEPNVFKFGASFQDRPSFTYGCVLLEEVDTPPYGMATVYRWQRDSLGNYIGAWVAFDVVSTDSSAAGILCFDLVFTGVVTKDFIASNGFDVQGLVSG